MNLNTFINCMKIKKMIMLLSLMIIVLSLAGCESFLTTNPREDVTTTEPVLTVEETTIDESSTEDIETNHTYVTTGEDSTTSIDPSSTTQEETTQYPSTSEHTTIEQSTFEETTIIETTLAHYTVLIEFDNGEDYILLRDIEAGSTIDLPTPDERLGYSFIGWFLSRSEDAEQFFDDDVISTDTIIYARWEKNVYEISFDSQGGSEVESIIAEYETYISEPNEPRRQGYEFDGWYIDGAYTEEYSFSRMPAEDIVLYAKWIGDQPSVIYSVMDEDYDVERHIAFRYNEIVKEVSLGDHHTVLLTNQGRVFTWGYNYFGQLGIGNTTDSIEPIEITHMFDLNPTEKIIKIAAGTLHTGALTDQGRVFTWGYNGNGQVGNDSTVKQLKPEDITSRFTLTYNERIIDIILGDGMTGAYTTKNRVFIWGKSLDDQATEDLLVPTDISEYFEVTYGQAIETMALGGNHIGLLTTDGRLYMWGKNNSGQLGNGTEVSETSPIDITNQFDLVAGERLVDISLGKNHSSALTSSGRLYMWGYNYFGQLGDGTNQRKTQPIDITSAISLNLNEYIEAIEMGGQHTSILTSEGRVYVWGLNNYGQLGLEVDQKSLLPLELVIGGQDGNIAAMVLGGNHSLAKTKDGILYVWGKNTNGQLGNGQVEDEDQPVQTLFRYPITEHSMMYETGEEINLYEPSKTGYMFSGWFIDEQMTQSFDGIFMPETDLHLYGYWISEGYGIHYVLNGGVNHPDNPSILTVEDSIVLKDPIKTGHRFLGWYLDSAFTIEFDLDSISTDTIIYARWEKNVYEISFDSQGGSEVESIIAEYETYISEPNEPRRQGYEFDGWYIDGAYTEEYSFSRMPAEDIVLYAKWIGDQPSVIYSVMDEDYDVERHIAFRYNEIVKEVSLGDHHTVLLTNQGRVFTWGYNYFGQLGIGNTTDSIEPIEITHMFDLNPTEKIIKIAAGTLHTGALTDQGRVFTWGYNGNGQVGNDSTVKQLKPEDITSRFTLTYNERIIDIILGDGMTGAYTTKNRVFIWGKSLDDQATEDLLVPTDISEYFEVTYGQAIETMALGGNHIGLLTTDGRLYMWGKNNSGQLGNGTEVSETSPIDITNQFDLVAGERLVDISLGKNHSSALTSSGRLYMWGYNYFGQLGDGTNQRKTQPIDITSAISLNLNEYIEAIEMGGQHTSILTSEGRVYVWGLNNYGQLGLEVDQKSLLPLELVIGGQDGNIAAMVLGGNHSLAKTKDGILYVWGKNTNGQLGNGQVEDEDQPVQTLFRYPITEHSMMYETGEEINLYEPSKTGYMFSGWFIDEQMTQSFDGIFMPETDLHLYGYWISEGYGIHYVLNGGVNHPDNPSILTVEDSIVLKDPIKTGHRFLGWYLDSAFTIEFDLDKIDEDDIQNGFSIYAKWAIRSYNIVFYNGDQIIYQKNFAYNQEIVDLNITEPIKTGFDFLGWDKEIPKYMPANDLEIYALWEETTQNEKINNFQVNITSQTASNLVVEIMLSGQVETCGFDVNLNYDDVIIFNSYHTDLPNFMVNGQEAGLIRFVYTDVSDNIEEEIVVVTLTFDIIDQGINIFDFEVNDIMRLMDDGFSLELTDYNTTSKYIFID